MKPKMITSSEYDTLPLSICLAKLAESLPKVDDFYDEAGLDFLVGYLNSCATELQDKEDEYGHYDARLWRMSDGSLFIISSVSQENAPAWFTATDDASYYKDKEWD